MPSPTLRPLIGLVAVLATMGSGSRLAAESAAKCVILELFTGSTDHDCGELLERLREFAAEQDGIVLVRRYVDVIPEDRERLRAAAIRDGLNPDRLPVVQVCGVAMAAEKDIESVVRWLERALDVEVYTRRGCPRCGHAKDWLPRLRAEYPALRPVILDLTADAAARGALAELVRRHRTAAASVPVFHLCDSLVVGFDRPETTGPRLVRVLEPWTRPCREEVGSAAEAGRVADESIDVPWLGRLDPERLGMPLFTLAIGLVDGFNPCAMWVLMLLLSILVTLEDRWRIVAIAGTFVAVSGMAYFAFMAAWLNVFAWIGMLRPVQVTLGLLALAVGCVHVKDSIAFRQGPSLSIPDAAKPGIYARIRGIVIAETLPAAVGGAVVLAVLVNMVELLCTAGLPALYTDILAQQGYPVARRYGYLGLYIAAYMFDDALILAGVVVTLRRFKLQERGGRWLKLLSGVVILALGLTMLLRPGWLEG